VTAEKNYKIWKAVDTSTAGMMVTPTASYLIGGKYNFIAASKSGVSIMGKSVTIGTTGESVRQGGLFIHMNDFVRMIPQTMVTPIPSQVPFPPLGMITQVLSDLPFFLSMLP